MRKQLWIVAFTLLAACNRGPGEPCGSSSACAEGGTCLKGVCSAFACQTDADCGELRCGEVAGSAVCVQDCASDEDCAGEQTCGELSGGDSADLEMICL